MNVRENMACGMELVIKVILSLAQRQSHLGNNGRCVELKAGQRKQRRMELSC